MATSPWIKHVMKYAKENKMKFGEALKKAGPSYKSHGSTNSEEPSYSNKKSRKMRKSRGKKSKSMKRKSSRNWF
jgi:hypothetical protein